MGPGTSTHMVILSPGGVLSFPEGLDVYADGPVCLISGAGFGVHSAPVGRSRQPWVPLPKLLESGFAQLHSGERAGPGG